MGSSGKPHVLDRLTLNNVNDPGEAGKNNLDRLLLEFPMFSAHLPYDAVKDVWVTFGYKFDPRSSNTKVNLYKLDNRNFRCTQKDRLAFTKEGPDILHDFILLEN